MAEPTPPMLTMTIGERAWPVDLTDEMLLGLVASVQFMSLAQQGIPSNLVELLAEVPADAEVSFEFTAGAA